MTKPLTEERVLELINETVWSRINPIAISQLQRIVESLEKEYFGMLERNP